MQRINEEIKNEKVRLVGEGVEGNAIITLEEALDKSYDEGLDLVEMSEKDGISICKIMNYQKYQYEQKKAKKQQTKKVSQKEIKFGCMIADHDLEVYANKAKKILNEGDKVKVIVLFRGRQMGFASSEGPKILEKFNSFLGDVVISKQPKLEGNLYSMVVEKK